MLGIPLSARAQDTEQMKDLERERERLQQELQQSQQELDRTRKDITTHQTSSHHLTGEIADRLDGIRRAEDRMFDLDRYIKALQADIDIVNKRLQEKKEKFARALRMARAYRHSQSPTLFILSGRKLTQMSRRARNTNYFATILRTMGEELVSKQKQLLATQNELLRSKSEMNNLLTAIMKERNDLGVQQDQLQSMIAALDNKERDLESKLTKQRDQLTQLNGKIDAVVAAEVEMARKRTETRRKKNSTNVTTGRYVTPEDKAINTSFEQNKGRLPVPITGGYVLGERQGQLNMPGTSDTQLDNKGTNYVGKSGARARSVFDGEVTAIFKFYDTKGVIIRHGSYISIYGNLSSVIVSQGQKVHARDLIGTIAANSDAKCILHFQLRKETTALTPEQWVSK